MNRFALLILLLGLGMISGCQKGPQPADTEGVQPIARDILNAVAQSDISEPYQTYFTEQYREDHPLPELQEYIALYNKRLGALISFQQNFAMSSAVRLGDSTEAHVYFDVVWERGDGELILQLTKPRDQWRIVEMTLDSETIKKSAQEPVPNIP
jgi:hypothetical protein